MEPDAPGQAPVILSPVNHADWSEAWYWMFMKVSAISFVVVDARRRATGVEALRARGIDDVPAYLERDVAEANRLRDAAVILDCNETAVRTFGGTGRADLIGQPTHRFFDPLCTTLRNAVRAYARGDTAFQQQARSVRLDGSLFDTLFCLVPRAPGVASGIWLAAFVDITDHLQRQSALDELRSELAHVSRISVLGELSASIAHEVGQPLAAIAIAAEAAVRMLDHAQPDHAAIRRICERIVGQTVRAGDIIDGVRRMADKRDNLPLPTPIGDILAEAVQFVRHDLQRDGVVLATTSSGGSDLVCVDRVQLQQVFVNLLMNAIQIHRLSGTPRPEIEVAIRRGDNALIIDVRDNGPGIAFDDLNRLFDGFFTNRAEGLGLGLRICRSIVEAHGGSIAAANRGDGGGAVFSISLPPA